MRIGVLALQGSFREHLRLLGRLGAEAVEVRLPSQLGEVAGLVIPGGESTAIGRSPGCSSGPPGPRPLAPPCRCWVNAMASRSCFARTGSSPPPSTPSSPATPASTSASSKWSGTNPARHPIPTPTPPPPARPPNPADRGDDGRRPPADRTMLPHPQDLARYRIQALLDPAQ